MFDCLAKDNLNIILALTLPAICLILGYTIGIHRRRTIENRGAVANRGEVLVRKSLKEYCKNREAHVLNCVTLRLKDGSTTQIDHILVSTRGIFVIETKHYRGWIFGNPTSKQWTQIIYKSKNTFQNPQFQNYKHVKEIQRIFEFLEASIIHNIVVFSGESEFKTTRPDNVFHINELIPTIEKYPDGVLSLNRVQFCVGRLEYMRLELTKKTDIEHQAYLMQKFGQ